jgi:hypothetical protein
MQTGNSGKPGSPKETSNDKQKIANTFTMKNKHNTGNKTRTGNIKQEHKNMIT